MIYSVVKIQVNGLTFSWFGINPFTHLDKGGQNAHPKSPLFQKILENIFLETKKPPISLVIEVNRRRVEIFIILVYNRKLRERQIWIRTAQIFHLLLAVISNRQNRRKALKSLGLLRNQNHPKLSSFIRCYPWPRELIRAKSRENPMGETQLFDKRLTVMC